MSISVNSPVPSTPQVPSTTNEPKGPIPAETSPSTAQGPLANTHAEGHLSGIAKFVSDSAFTVVGQQKTSLGTLSGGNKQSLVQITPQSSSLTSTATPKLGNSPNLQKELSHTNQTSSIVSDKQLHSSSREFGQVLQAPKQVLSSPQTLVNNGQVAVSDNKQVLTSNRLSSDTSANQVLGKQTTQTQSEPKIFTARELYKPVSISENKIDVVSQPNDFSKPMSSFDKVNIPKENVVTNFVQKNVEKLEVSPKQMGQANFDSIVNSRRELQNGMAFINKSSVVDIGKGLVKNDSKLNELASAQSGSKAAVEEATKKEKSKEIVVTTQVPGKEQNQQQKNSNQDQEQNDEDRPTSRLTSKDDSKVSNNNLFQFSVSPTLISALTQSEIDNIKVVSKKTSLVFDKWSKSLVSSDELNQAIQELDKTLVSAGFASVLPQAKLISSEIIQELGKIANQLSSSNTLTEEDIKSQINQLFFLNGSDQILGGLLGKTSDGKVFIKTYDYDIKHEYDKDGNETRTYTLRDTPLGYNATSAIDSGVFNIDQDGNIVTGTVTRKDGTTTPPTVLNVLHFSGLGVPTVVGVDFNSDEQAIQYALHLGFYSKVLNILKDKAGQASDNLSDILNALLQSLTDSLALLKHS